MVIDMIITDTGDGYSSEVPSLKGCECWAHSSDEAIEKTVEMVRFYAGIPEDIEILVDRARKTRKAIVYKLIFDKK